MTDQLHRHFLASNGVSTDSRSIQSGQLYFALQGPYHNGNAFAPQALERGASLAVVDDPRFTPKGDARYLAVPDALEALQQLAIRHRRTLSTPVLAVTGSNGKTTTKELLARVLANTLHVHATPGNWNNHIGVPLSILRLTPEHELAVLELADNRPGEIDFLCQVAEPRAGLITNIGLDHIGNYADLDANARAKLELFDYLHLEGGKLFVNLADPYLAPYARMLHGGLTYGSDDAHWNFRVLERSLRGMRLEIYAPQGGNSFEVQTPLMGLHNAENVLAAVAVGLHYGVEPSQISEAVAAYHPTNNRSQVRTIGPLRVVLDAYNANPSSMEATLRTVLHDHPQGVVCILGDMRELGNHTQAEHRKLGELVAELRPARFVGVGADMAAATAAAQGVATHHYPDVKALLPHLAELTEGAKVVLLKGSRELALETLVPELESAYGI
jgi:UDP-N-acetylmuramoyl-tripeptide--D-alanyl-D-alanine ligase